MTKREQFFGVTEIYCKRRMKDCKNCYEKCKYRTENPSNKKERTK